MTTRPESEQIEFRNRIETTRRETRLYSPVESRVLDDQPGDYVYYHALDEAQQAFVVGNADLDVDLVLRVYAADGLLTRAEFEALVAEGN